MSVSLGSLKQQALNALRTPLRNIWLAFNLPARPVCQSRTTANFATNEQFRIYECRSCSHQFVGNPRRSGQLKRLYQGLKYWDKDRNHQGIFDVRSRSEWKGYLDARLKALESAGVSLTAVPPGALCLEIGCLRMVQASSFSRKDKQYWL